MKKKLICIILACFLFVGVPVKGYAASLSPLVFGMSEEVVLAFLASLLGVSAKEAINSYDDLTAYENDLRLGFTEYIAGSATALQVAEWIQEAVVGNIDKSSIVWQKFYEYCMTQYVPITDGVITVPSNNPFNLITFNYVNTTTAHLGSTSFTDIEAACSYYARGNNRWFTSILVASSQAFTNSSSYYYNGYTVYYFKGGVTTFGSTPYDDISPSAVEDSSVQAQINSKADQMAWEMIYGGYSVPSASIGVLSGPFDNVLTSSSVDGLIDGTSVLQLYNPAVAQNGLQIVPDPEDPDDIVVPAMLTADWYNFLKQFGTSGASQFVAAYNALNAVQGVSTGAINAIYNNLGIASAISSATQAAQGTLTITDNNVFPQSSTVADAVNGVIPGALTPETPDSWIDNESDQGLYKLPDLKDFFPFCIPFDLIDLLSCFIAEPETPQFVIALSTGEDTVTGQMDLHIWDNIASVLRGLELMAFTVGLILITRNIIRG